MPDFEEILSKPFGEVEKPKPKPLGTYIAVTTGVPQQITRNTRDGQEMKILSFNLKRISVVQLNNPDAMDETIGMEDWPSLTWDFMIHSENGIYALQEALKNVFDLVPDGQKSFGEILAETPNHQVMVTNRHEPYTDRNGQPGIADRVDSVAHV